MKSIKSKQVFEYHVTIYCNSKPYLFACWPVLVLRHKMLFKVKLNACLKMLQGVFFNHVVIIGVNITHKL